MPIKRSTVWIALLLMPSISATQSCLHGRHNEMRRVLRDTEQSAFLFRHSHSLFLVKQAVLGDQRQFHASTA